MTKTTTPTLIEAREKFEHSLLLAGISVDTNGNLAYTVRSFKEKQIDIEALRELAENASELAEILETPINPCIDPEWETEIKPLFVESETIMREFEEIAQPGKFVRPFSKNKRDYSVEISTAFSSKEPIDNNEIIQLAEYLKLQLEYYMLMTVGEKNLINISERCAWVHPENESLFRELREKAITAISSLKGMSGSLKRVYPSASAEQ